VIGIVSEFSSHFLMQARSVSEDELLLLHTQEHISLMQETASMKLCELARKQDDFRSIYLHPGSYEAACLAAGSVLQVRMCRGSGCGQKQDWYTSTAGNVLDS
jgi:acetoin utilization deacetylase AcuC-like enzyme